MKFHKVTLYFALFSEKLRRQEKKSGTAGLEGAVKDQLLDDISVFKCYLKKAGTETLKSENKKSQIAQKSSQMFQYKTKITKNRLLNVFPFFENSYLIFQTA